MKFSAIVSSLVSISLQYGVNANDSSKSLRGAIDNHRALRVQQPCTLIRVETEFEDELEENNASRERMYNGSGNSGTRKLNPEEIQIKCELQEEDRAVVGKHFISINGIETSQLDNIVSGDTTLMAEEAMIMDGEMWLPAGAAIEFGSNGQNNRRLQTSRTHGIKKVLVVRADAQGSVTTATKETLSDKVFGTNGDTATLKSQYLACSHGKLIFQPFQGMTTGGTYVENGVIDVTITNEVPGASRYDIEDALEEAADKLVGSLREQFDHVMLCLPPGSASGSNRNWVAYGYVNSWLTVFNDDYCKSMSTQVHEIGHNLGLSHSGKDGVSYGDKSGIMGYSYKLDNGPMQCFNPAKTYQLGWVDDKVVTVDPNDGTWVGTLIGATDYTNAIVDQNAHVIVKIETGEFKDLFVGYNRKKGMNSGVGLAGDRVTIVEQGPGYSKSEFLAGLSIEESTIEESKKTFYNFGGTNKNLVVDFVGRGSRSDDEVIIAIYYDTCVYPSCSCVGSVCDSIIDLSPIATTIQVQSPIASPTQVQWSPTTAPTVRQPTSAPTRKRMYDINSNADKNRPIQLLFENFVNDLGAFNGGGNDVEQNMFQFVLTAKFELKEVGKLPSISTDLDLLGTSVVKVSFWYNAERMQNKEGFKLQYSINHGNSWRDVRDFKFGEGGFDKLKKWNHAKSESFEVDQGTSSTQVRFVGETETNNSNSVFYIAGVTISGTAQ